MTRLIIHLDDCPDTTEGLRRIANALPVYYESHPDQGQRLTIRFEPDGALLIYHDWKSLIIFTQQVSRRIQ